MSLNAQTGPEQFEELEVGRTYRLKPRQIGGYLYNVDYERGNYIDVRVLSGPDQFDRYMVTTRNEAGQHIGPGGGWVGESTLWVHASECEEVF